MLAYAAIELVENYPMTPLIVQRNASLHAAVALAAVTVLGVAFGILGALPRLPVAVRPEAWPRSCGSGAWRRKTPRTRDHETERLEERGRPWSVRSVGQEFV